jgi:hypothetical protein
MTGHGDGQQKDLRSGPKGTKGFRINEPGIGDGHDLKGLFSPLTPVALVGGGNSLNMKGLWAELCALLKTWCLFL